MKKTRTKEHKDGLMWFSDTANALLYEEYFQLTNIEKDFLPVFKNSILMRSLEHVLLQERLWMLMKDLLKRNNLSF